MKGEASPVSSETVSAMPICEIDMSKPRAIVARNGGAKRYEAFAVVRAIVSSTTWLRTTGENDSSKRLIVRACC
jgi:hypothetical protein